MFGFIGIGQAGGNVANSAAKKGFKSVAINYSQTDLNSLDSVHDKLKLIGSEGVGKRREDAIEMMPQNIELFQEFSKEHFSSPSIEIIIVAFGTGGGTGSGISPLLIEILSNQMENKVIVACPILPSKNESPISLFNTIKVSEELSKLNVAVFPIDNEKMANKVVKSKLYATINENLVTLLENLYRYTEQHSVHGVLDRKDVLELFKTEGVGLIAVADVARLSSNSVTKVNVEGISSQVYESWDESIFVSPELKNIESLGIIFDGQESLMSSISHQSIASYFDNTPLYVYEGYYRNSNGKVMTILSGMSWYNSRLKELENLLDKNKINQRSQSVSYQSEIKIDLSKKEKNINKKSALDILKKYQNR